MPPEVRHSQSSAARRRALLWVRRLSAGWGEPDAVRDVSFRLEAGERVALLGANGAGKTTLFDVVAGRLPARSGRVLLAGESLSGLAPHQRARRGLGYVPQEPTVFPDLSVRANLVAAALSPAAMRSGSGVSAVGGLPSGQRAGGDIEARVDSALRHWGLVVIQQRKGGVLSGGERRRVEVARALMACPSLLLLDEPFAGLDPEGRAALRTGLIALPSSVTLLLTDHVHEDVLSVCERAVLLQDGAVVFDGPAQEAVTKPPRIRPPIGA